MMAELLNAVRQIYRVASGLAQVVSRQRLAGSPLAIAIATFLIAPVPANAQGTPEPPQQLCIEGASNCGTTDDGTGVGGTSESKRWNPGHYVKAQGNHAQADAERYYTSVTTQLSKVEDSAEIRGAQVTYAWGLIEPSLGNYDFGPIYNHLDYLSARGKKMILSINSKCFGNDCANLAPSDLQSAVYVTPKDPPTLTMALWEEKNMDLYIALWQALAVEFDGNPAVEMVLGAESTPSLQGSSPANFSKEVYAAQLKRLYSAQAAAFKSTNVIANINFLSGEVAGLVEHAFQVGIGRGMPDIFDSDGSLIFRGECEDLECGLRDYRGSIPHFGVASYQQLIGKFSADTDTPPETLVYGLENKLTHYAWVTNESGEDSWENIISAIEAANPDGYTGCPTAYKDCSN